MKLLIENVTESQLNVLRSLWHTKNDIILEDATVGSHTLFWWRCSQKHEFQTRIATMIRGLNSKTKGCPYCRGLKASDTNCVLATHPQLATEWYPNNEISPTEVTAGSNKKVKWQCTFGHIWCATILSRKQGNNCPYCSQRIVDSSNCIFSTHPKLASEWHPTKNEHINPNQISAGSGIKIWWKCPVAEDHEWQATPNKRSRGTGCPCCSGKKIVKSNCLLTLFPDISNEWHPTRNGATSPLNISPGSQQKYW